MMNDDYRAEIDNEIITLPILFHYLFSIVSTFIEKSQQINEIVLYFNRIKVQLQLWCKTMSLYLLHITRGCKCTVCL